jgi:hypothetical protein
VKKLPRAWAEAVDAFDEERAAAAVPVNRAASARPPMANLLIPITSKMDITEREVGNGSRWANATALNGGVA